MYRFQVSVDRAQWKFKLEHPEYNDPAIKLILEQRPDLQAQGATLDSKLGSGTLDVFCKDATSTHI